MTLAMIFIRSVLVVLALALGAPLGHAAEATYPPGSRIGLVPPGAMVPSKNFFGYEDPDNNVAIILVALPPQAYPDLETSVTADALKRQGLTLEAREAVALPSGQAFLVIGRQETEKAIVRKWILVASSPALTALVTVQIPDAARPLYPDAAIREALATVAVRVSVPMDEQLGLVPFKVGELAGFRIGGVLPGRAVVLSDGPANLPGSPDVTIEPHIVVAVAPGGPTQSGERDAFARDVFATVPNLKEIRVTTSESLRLGGQQGHQIIATAKDAAGTSPLTVVQWLRFGSGAFLQMVGIARTEAWKGAYPRFRLVRDGIDAR
jgi:hypothetical protein